jgi:epoxyqueuosine reductase
MNQALYDHIDLSSLKQQIQQWGRELGFQQISVADLDLSAHESHLRRWLQQHFNGDMDWMAENIDKRCHPEQLHTGTMRVITARMDYRPEHIPLLPEEHGDLLYKNTAQISCYAQGRDYHKVMRARLTQLGKRINDHLAQFPPHNSRAFVDSAPVLERALAEKSGLGWIGKNTMLINKNAGSLFFLGELFTNLPLPLDAEPDNSNYSSQNHCGTCSACISSCPTGAIVAPYQVDARKCISYLTIEHKGSIPLELRSLMGNRIFGCDDCQLVCPWNKFSETTTEKDFSPRVFTQNRPLHELFLWSEEEFLKQTEGSPIRRVGYERWLRNIAIGLGNAQPTAKNISALQQRKDFPSALVQEHLEWALENMVKS